MSSPAKRQPVSFGKYVLLDRINIGGMAEVWRGKEAQPSNGQTRLVAIKRILPNIAEDEEFIRMFIDEAKISVQLTHPNIAAIHDLGNIGSSYFITLEYIPGRDLRAVFDRCRKRGEQAPIAFTCYVISQLCLGMDYAHRKKDAVGREMNIVHRDVSPQNVLISYEGEVKVIDFGIAKAAGKATRTQAGILKGKFAYMSPEQIRGVELDRRADIFAIGICLHEMLTGERLFTGDSDYSVLERVRKADVPKPSSLNPRVPEALEKMVLKALARETEDRYQYASDLGEDLRRFLASSGQTFGRRELSTYMKGLFAEEVERERQRVEEYVGVKSLAELASPHPGPSLAVSGVHPPVEPTRPEPGRPSAPVPVLVPSPAAPAPALVRASGAAPPLPPSALANPLNDDATGSHATVLMDREAFLESLDAHTDPRAQSGAVPSVSPTSPGPGSVATGSPAASRPSEGALPSTPARATSPSLPPAAAPAAASTLPSPSPDLATVPIRGPQSSGASASVDTAPSPNLSATAISVPAGLRRSLEAATSEAGDTESGDDPDQTMSSEAGSSELPEPPTRSLLGWRLRAGTELDEGDGAWWQDRRLQLGALASVAFVALMLLVFALTGGSPQAFVVVDVPPDARGKVSLTVDGRDYGTPDSPGASAQAQRWPVVIPIDGEKAQVQLEGSGYERYTEWVHASDAEQPSVHLAELRRTRPVAKLAVVASVEQAQIAINGEVVRAEGLPGRVWTGELEVGKPARIEVRRRGFRGFETTLIPKTEAPVELSADLRAFEFPVHVGSDPKGAIVSLDGKDVGRTPMNLRVPFGAKELVLRRSGYCEERVPLRLPEVPGSPTTVNRKLSRRPGC